MKITKNLVLLGGGGHCKSVIDVAENAGYKIIGILDKPENVGEKVLDYTIIGTDENISDYVSEAMFLITVGQIKDTKTRINIHDKVLKAGGHFATVIAPTAHVSRYAEIGEGTVIMHNAVVNADAKIGKGCIVNTFANIEHDALIGDYCHISTGAMVNGNCTIGESCFLGSQSVLINGIAIADHCVIAAGSTVRKDILKGGIYSGNPAKLKIKL